MRPSKEQSSCYSGAAARGRGLRRKFYDDRQRRRYRRGWRVVLLTTDKPAGQAAERVLPRHGDEFQRIDGGSSGLDLSSATPLGSVYRFPLTHASYVFRQSEIVDAIDRPREEVESALTRLYQRGSVKHQGQFWTIADTEHAVASAGLHGIAIADRDCGFSEEDVSTWMDTAVDPVGAVHHDVEGENS